VRHGSVLVEHPKRNSMGLVQGEGMSCGTSRLSYITKEWDFPYAAPQPCCCPGQWPWRGCWQTAYRCWDAHTPFEPKIDCHPRMAWPRSRQTFIFFSLVHPPSLGTRDSYQRPSHGIYDSPAGGCRRCLCSQNYA
jgi:hypothetical protein